jgi:hypothetical protein
VDPSKPTDPPLDQPHSIPRTRQDADEVLEGEILPKGATLGRPTANADPRMAPAPPPRPPKRRGGRLRTILIVALALSVGLCLGGLAYGYLVYDKVTKPDRSSPTLVVRQYLSATFDTRDALTAARFTCQDPSSMTEVQALLKWVKDQEQKYDIHIQVQWTGMSESVNGDQATVPTDLRIQVPESNGQISESIQHWSFGLRGASDWRVCSASKLG